MSVGHVARTFEEAGIPTVSVYVRAFRHVVGDMRLSRAVVTRHPMGRPFGAPFDAARHRQVLSTALELLETAVSGGAVVELEEPYRVPDDT